jgi:hypothetical protein
MKHQFHIKTNNENEFNDIKTEKTLLASDRVFETRTNEGNGRSMGVWQGVTMDSQKFHPAGGPPLKRPYSLIMGGPSIRQVACSRLLPLWTPHAIRV